MSESNRLFLEKMQCPLIQTTQTEKITDQNFADQRQSTGLVAITDRVRIASAEGDTRNNGARK
jgi:hypothetical protein